MHHDLQLTVLRLLYLTEMASNTSVSSFELSHLSIVSNIDAVLRKCKSVQESIEQLASEQPIPVVMLCMTYSGHIIATTTLYLEEKIPHVLLDRMRIMDEHNWLNVAFGDLNAQESNTRQHLLDLAEIKIDLSNGIPSEYTVVMVKSYYC
jgi:hypothetical protein